MMLDPALGQHLALTFKPLQNKASGSFPGPASLSTKLGELLPKQDVQTDVNASPEVVSMFATAAVEMWHRAVHSFLVSASLTDTSPIWSSVAGYYSSHYSVRALAHSIGYFQLFKQGRIIELGLGGTKPICTYHKKSRGDGEHKLYWKLVKANNQFNRNDLFTENTDASDFTDVGHRNYANYMDHIGGFPPFAALTEKATKARIERISTMQFVSAPIPRKSKFPDLATVQVVAYHRAIGFRQLIDEALGGGNRFWKYHRDPAWAKSAMSFQLTSQIGLDVFGNS